LLMKLSKSKFTAGLQCLKRLWNQCHRPDEKPAPDPATQALFDTGHQMGKFARRLIPGGVLVEEDYMHHKEAIETTQRLIADETVPAIYEAAFVFEDIRIRVDILERLPGGRWQMLEVKSSTSVHDYHFYDVAIQKYVLDGCGLVVEAVCLVHLNNQYVYDGTTLDLGKLFTIEDVSDQVAEHGAEVVDLLARGRAVLELAEPPAIRPGRHCSSPYCCEWWDECRASMPEFWVNEVHNIRAPVLAQLAALGVEQIADIPDSIQLNPMQKRIRDCIRSGEMYVGPDLKNAFDDLAYPVHYLDFETFMPAIPRYKDTNPYQTLPVQWSDHVLHEDGRLGHHEWLCDDDRDPRQEFAETLIAALGGSGSVVHYVPYEKTRLNTLIEALPNLAAELQAIVDRLWDLAPVIHNNVYHPRFFGSFSLKAVLPVLVPEMSYDALDIQEGDTAQVAYAEMINAGTSPERKTELRRQLLAYCAQDTMAMVRLHEKCLELNDAI